MQFKFGTRYETIIHREIKSVIRIYENGLKKIKLRNLS
jgi:hypothetical protein